MGHLYEVDLCLKAYKSLKKGCIINPETPCSSHMELKAASVQDGEGDQE